MSDAQVPSKDLATPRTDAVVQRWHLMEMDVVPATLARELERELAEARALIEGEWFNRVTYKQQLRSAQARIDSLMLEHCPDEMTQEQRDRWAESQRAAQPPGDGQ